MTLLPRRSSIGMTILGRSVDLVLRLRHELLVAGDAGLRLRLAGLGRGRDPFLLAIDGALARHVLTAFLGEALLLLNEPSGVVALVGVAPGAVEFEDPAGDVVEEVAIVGHDQDRAGILLQVAFEPVHRLGVEMVGGLVEEEQFRLPEQQLAERHAAALAARQGGDRLLVAGAAEGLHGLIDLRVELPQILGFDLVLEGGHLVRRLLGIVHREFVVAVEQRLLLGDALHHVLAHRLVGIELRLLRQVADAGALGDEALAGPFCVDAGHDLEQGRLARAVDAEHADLGVRIERQVDVIEDLFAAGIGLCQTLHVVDEFARHERPVSLTIAGRRGAWALDRPPEMA